MIESSHPVWAYARKIVKGPISISGLAWDISTAHPAGCEPDLLIHSYISEDTQDRYQSAFIKTA